MIWHIIFTTHLGKEEEQNMICATYLTKINIQTNRTIEQNIPDRIPM